MRLLALPLYAGCTFRWDPAPPPAIDAVTIAEACHGARECQEADYGCAIFSDDDRPPWCANICANHNCCERDPVLGDWRVRTFDCSVDAGVDALPLSDAGASDAR